MTSFPVSASRRGGGTVGQDTCTSQDGGPGRGWVKFFGFSSTFCTGRYWSYDIYLMLDEAVIVALNL